MYSNMKTSIKNKQIPKSQYCIFIFYVPVTIKSALSKVIGVHLAAFLIFSTTFITIFRFLSFTEIEIL